MGTATDDHDQERATQERAIRMKIIAFDKKLSPTAIRVAAVIYLGFLDRKTNTTEYGQEAIAFAIGDTNVKTVQTAIRQLENGGHIQVDRYKGLGGTNIVTWLPPTKAETDKMLAIVNGAAAKQRDAQEARTASRTKSRARQSEEIVRLKDDEAGKKIPVERTDNGWTGKNLPAHETSSVGRNRPVEGAQSEEKFRQSYSRQRSINKVSELDSSYWQ